MAMAPVDITGFYNWGVQVDLVPWRGLLIGLALFVVGIFVLPLVTLDVAVLLSSLFALLVVPIALEAVFRVDVVTDTALVRKRGLFGTSRKVIPLAEIDRVE